VFGVQEKTNNVLNPEVYDATGDAMKNKSPVHKILSAVGYILMLCKDLSANTKFYNL